MGGLLFLFLFQRFIRSATPIVSPQSKTKKKEMEKREKKEMELAQEEEEESSKNGELFKTPRARPEFTPLPS